MVAPKMFEELTKRAMVDSLFSKVSGLQIENRSRYRRQSVRKGVPRNFAKFTGTRISFLIKLQVYHPRRPFVKNNSVQQFWVKVNIFDIFGNTNSIYVFPGHRQ